MRRSSIFFGGMILVLIVLFLALAVAVMQGPASRDHGLQYSGSQDSELPGADLIGGALSGDQYYYWGDTWGGEGYAVGQFRTPTGIVAGPDNSIYVADTLNNRVQKLGTDGKWVEFTQSFMPEAMAIAGDGTFYIYRYAAGIDVYDRDGQYVKTWKNDSGVINALGMAVNGANSLFVTDYSGLWFFWVQDNAGHWGMHNFGEGDPRQLSWPRGVAVSTDGNYYVADTNNNRIEHFTEHGDVDVWGGPGSGPKQFDQPSGIAVDLDGYVYVADTGNNRIQVFDPDGVYKGSMGNSRTLKNPEGVAVDTHYNVYVTDTGNNRVRKLVPGQPRPA
ncbi:MAG: NHL repeat-containing protein [Methanocella sp.]